MHYKRKEGKYIMISVESKVCFEQGKPNKVPETEYITYKELAEKVGTMVLCEEMDKRYRDFIDTKYKNENEISQEEINLLLNTYQWHIITKEAAEYLQRETGELVYYDKVLNVYAWGIGTDNINWENEPSTVKKI